MNRVVNMNGRGVYYILNMINGKCYVGSAKCMHRRTGNHVSTSRNSKHINKKVENAFNKYGIENFEFGVIVFTPNVKTEKELQDIEQKWIDLLKPEYNIRKKASRSSYIAEKKERPNRVGFKHSEKTKKLMSESSKGHSRGKGIKRTKPNPNKGKKMNIQRPKGELSHSYGRVIPQEEIDRRLEVFFKNQDEKFIKTLNPIIQLDLNGNFIKEWKHEVDAGRTLGIKRELIQKVLDGRYKQTNNFLFIYKHEYSEEKLKLSIENLNPKKRAPSEKSIIYQYDLNGVFIREWAGVREAAKKLKIARVGIIQVCKGKKEHAGKYLWKRKIEIKKYD